MSSDDVATIDQTNGRKKRPGFLRRLSACKRGNVAMMFGLIAIPVMLAVGLGVDGSRALIARFQLQSAVDAATLAVGTFYDSEEELRAKLLEYADRNFDLGGARLVSVDLVIDGDTITAQGQAVVDTYFMPLINQHQVRVNVASQARRPGGGLMVSLVLDNTGSMWSRGNIEGLRDATDTLVDELFGDDNDPDKLRVAMVPYASTVNPGAEALGIVNIQQLRDTYMANLGFVPDDGDLLKPGNKQYWKGCVVERWGDDSIDDTPPSTQEWTAFWSPSDVDNNYDPRDPDTIIPGGDYSSNGITGPNNGCPTAITPLTNDYDTVKAATDALTAWNRGGTLTDIGLAWGLRTLSPGAPFTESTERDKNDGQTLWDSPRWRRALVLMTDGESLFYDLPRRDGPNDRHPGRSDFTGYGRLGEALADSLFRTDNANRARDEINDRVAALCQRAKDDNITVYVVVFTSSVQQRTRDMYEDCASDPGKYWYAPDADALVGAFGAIGKDLTKLRLTI